MIPIQRLGGGIFGKLYYEGAAEKKWDWQSTGGSDDFEPKLSLIPLIFGTLKGTLYAMVFAVPIAILAAMSPRNSWIRIFARS